MNRPSRDTTAGRVYLDLQAEARRLGRPTDELFVLYILERFLFRLSLSPLRRQFVLKGGMLLAALDERRATRDVDLLARATENDIDTTASLVREILAIDVDDGVVYEPARMAANVIRDEDTYTGVRIVVPARVNRAEHPLRIDVNVGDPVTPSPVEIAYPALLGEPFTILGVPARNGARREDRDDDRPWGHTSCRWMRPTDRRRSSASRGWFTHTTARQDVSTPPPTFPGLDGEHAPRRRVRRARKGVAAGSSASASPRTRSVRTGWSPALPVVDVDVVSEGERPDHLFGGSSEGRAFPRRTPPAPP